MIRLIWNKIVVRPNVWYDGLREPGRFLMFMSAIIPLFFLVALEDMDANIIGYFGLAILGLPRIAFVVWRNIHD